jgi:L-asparaginase
MPAILAAREAGIVVVATTRCPAGRLIRDHYGLPTRCAGDERDLLDAGALFSDLQGPKARIGLAVGLSAGLTTAELQRILDTGETAQGG